MMAAAAKKRKLETEEADKEDDKAKREASFSHVFVLDNPGRVDDCYSIDSKLGEGGYGTVSLARSKATNDSRAVKSIDIKSFSDKSLRRFHTEVSLMKQVDHPNIIRLYETFKDAKCVYLVMEVCTGGELFDKLTEEAPAGFTEGKVATYMGQIMAGISYLHGQCIAHRDIKLENFLLQDKSQHAEIKLIDFGLSARFEKGHPLTTSVGTAYYIAPEVQAKSYNHKCDVWSCGVVAYMLLSGAPPFNGVSDSDILKVAKSGKFDFDGSHWNEISKLAKQFVTAALTLKPAERPEATDMRSHQWLKKETRETLKKPLGPTIVARFKAFNKLRKLKKLCLTLIATQLGDSEITTLRQQFKALDKNGDGVISQEELKGGLKRIEGAKSKSALEALFAIDTDGSGQIDYTEFVAAALDRRKYLRREIIWRAFRTFDLDGDGKITKDELNQVLAGGLSSEPNLPDATQIQSMFAEADKNSDGCIDFEEFMEMMKGK